MDLDALRAHYTGVRAVNYERKRASDPKWHREQGVVRDLLASVATADSTVLDVPVGTGRFFGHYAELGCRVIGVDISPDMRAQAAQRAEEHAPVDISLVEGDIAALDLHDHSVDVAVCIRFASLINARTLDHVVGELARVASYIIIGVTTQLTGAEPASLTQRTSRRVRRMVRLWSPEGRKVVVHPTRTVEEIFGRHSLDVQRHCEIRRRDAHGDATSIYLLRRAV